MDLDLAYINLMVGESLLATLTDKSNGTINTVFVQACIDRANAKVNTVLYAKYGSPLSFVSGSEGDDAKTVIKGIKYDICLYLIYKRKYDDEEMKDVYVNFSKAHSELEKLRKGEIILSGIEVSQAAAASFIVTDKISDDRIFTNERMGGSWYQA